MHTVFISYSSRDKDIADYLCEQLENNGVECWIAPRNETGGKTYAEGIVVAIKSATIVLLISSLSILDSEHVLSEVAIAFDEKKIILPFKIDDSEYNDNYRYYLSRKHWINAFPEPRKKVNELIETVLFLNSNKVSTDTEGNKDLIAISEKNRNRIIDETKQKRYSLGLSIADDNFEDRYHLYECVKRIDVLNSNTGNYSSYRWLTIKNVSSTPTRYIYHKECGENKVKFEHLRIRAKAGDVNGPNLPVESVVEIQPNFIQVFKIMFNKELEPGETMTIFYRLDWPGELMSYYEGELSQSISLTRYICGTKKLIFGVLDVAQMYDFSLRKINNNFEEKICGNAPIEFTAQDDEQLQKLNNPDLKGAFFEVEDATDDHVYRIMYKVNSIETEDFF